MARQRRRANPARIIILSILVAGALYLNFVVVPATPPLFIPTPTPTRAPESFLTEAQALAAEGKVNQAILTYEEAIKADPTNPATYVTLARLQVLYGDYVKAMENVETAIMLNPQHALAHAVRGWILGKQGDYVGGESAINTALELDPNSALAYAFRAEIYKDMLDKGKGDFNTIDKAIRDSQKAIDLDPSQLEVRRARGLVLEVTGNYGDAIKEFEAALAMNQNLAELYVALGRNYRFYPEGNPDYYKAQDYLNRAIALRPDISAPYSELAQTYLSMGEYSKGIQIAEQAVEREPYNALMYGLLGSLYYRNYQYAAAADALGMAINGGMSRQGVHVEPIAANGEYTFVMYYSRYGIALAYLGRCSEALPVGQKLVDLAVPDYYETAVLNAEEMENICRDLAENAPAVEPTQAAPEGESSDSSGE